MEIPTENENKGNKMDELIQIAGANARALGRSELDNPYYKSENMPEATHEDVSEWERKAAMWSIGWKTEDAIKND